MGSPGLLIAGIAFLTIAANIVALIGCISPTVKDIALYRVNVTLVANELHTLANLDSRNKTNVPRSSELPTYWYWGFSGLCDVYDTTGDIHCRRAFPPTENLLSIVQDSLRDRYGDDQQNVTNSVVASWNATLSNLSPSRLASKEGVFASESKASAALAILAIALDFITILLAVCSMRRGSSSRWVSSAPLLSALVTGAAGVLAFLSMRNGVPGATSTDEHMGPAVIILFVAAAVRAVSAAGAGYDASVHTPRPPPGRPPYSYDYPGDYETTQQWGETGQQWGVPPQGPPQQAFESGNHALGFKGENHIYNWLASRLPGWSGENWTSGLRTHAGYQPFTQNEAGFADFTYEDRDLQMRRLLAEQGLPVSPSWSSRTTYHVEVKSTPHGREAPFYVSAYQVRLMNRYARSANDVYILARVSHVNGRPTTELFVNPDQHDGLAWGPLRSDGYHEVRVR